MRPRPAATIHVLTWIALALGGCDSFRASDTGLDDDDPQLGRCTSDLECVLAGPSCCECPTYATTVASGWAESCANVDCNAGGGTDAGTMGGGCPRLVATCTFGMCLAACAPIACELSCAQGFATDPSGCLTCACAAMPAPAQCLLDEDCVQVPADCCGCARGGADTAVPRGAVAEHNDGLGCGNPGDAACPDVSTCDPEAAVRCQEGRCALVGRDDPGWSTPPPGACGRTDLPACPDGQACVLNRDDGATALGLGVCVSL